MRNVKPCESKPASRGSKELAEVKRANEEILKTNQCWRYPLTPTTT